MSKFLFCILILVPIAASAQYSGYNSSSASSRSSGSGHQFVTPALGFLAPGENMVAGTNNNGNIARPFFLSGLFALGVDYDYMMKSDVSLGGFLRYYSVTSTVADTQYKNTLITLGPSARGYWSTESWLASFGTGFELLVPSYSTTPQANGGDMSIPTTIGWMFSLQFFYKLSDQFALGFENMKLIGLSQSVNGVLVNDYVFKGRIAL